MRRIISSLVVVVASVGIAAAQPAPKKGGGDDNKTAGNGKVKVYDFSGDTIEGDLIKPEGSTVDARDFAKHASLIRIRTTFLPEIIKSAEDL
jgi:hypothetical protein